MLRNFMCGKRRRRRRRRRSFLYGCGIRLTGHIGGMNLVWWKYANFEEEVKEKENSRGMKNE
jgi:hypothetical protein